MLGIIDFSTFLIGTIVIVLLPGPNSLYVMVSAAKAGTKAGYIAALGIFAGDSILMLVTVFGAASLLKAQPALFFIIKLLGAIYLAWLGLQLLQTALQRLRNPQTLATTPLVTHTDITNRPPYFRHALTVSLLNPKAILFFFAFFIQFVDPNAPYPLVSFAVLGVVVQICSMLYLSGLIFAGTTLNHFFNQHRILSNVSIVLTGVLFFAFAGKLLFASL